LISRQGSNSGGKKEKKERLHQEGVKGGGYMGKRGKRAHGGSSLHSEATDRPIDDASEGKNGRQEKETIETSNPTQESRTILRGIA